MKSTNIEDMKVSQATLGASWESTVDVTARSQSCIPLELDRRASWSPHGFRKQKAQFDRVYFSKSSAKAFCCDLKTCALNRFPCDKIKKDQLDKLMDVGQAVPAGYLIYFRKVDRVVWFNWQDLFEAHIKRESLLYSQGIQLGSLVTFKLQAIFDLR